MARFCVCPTTGLRRGAWTLEEDELLTSHIARHGHSNWRLLPEKAGLARDGKSCRRLRWMNYLRPDLKRGNFTEEEDAIIIGLHERLGNRWSAIALSLPGRTDNEIKNHWHTELKKRNVTAEVPRLNSIEPSTVTPLSPLASSGSFEILNLQNQTVENDVDFDLDGEFWKDPFTLENSSGEFFSPLEEASPLSPYEASNYNENDRYPMPDYLSIVHSPREMTLDELFDL